MNLEIKKLTPEMIDEYLYFFEFICEDAGKDGYDFVESYPYKQQEKS